MSKVTFCLVFFLVVFTAQAFPVSDMDIEEEEPQKDFLIGLLHHAAHGVLNLAHGAVDLTAGVLGDENNKDAEVEDHRFYRLHHRVLDPLFTRNVEDLRRHGDEENKDVESENVPAVSQDKENDDDLLIGLLHHAAHGVLDLAGGAVDLTAGVLGDENNKDAKVEEKATEKTE